MKKIKIISGIIVGLILITFVTADLMGVLPTWNKKMSFTPEQEAQAKKSSGVKDIDINVSKISCDDKYCYVDRIYQKGIIQTSWKRSKDYCSEWNCKPEITYEGIYCEGTNLTIEVTCLERTDYTMEENKQTLKDYVEGLVGTWANAEMERDEAGIAEVKVDEGSLTTK